ncbi:hypothetical protein Tco_0803723 [Tanacetum coccineum]|uniref:Uncharacterized protein n=1 Tax=Tanacetum coccineum TaxID=301880 RepID=A0ABQ5A3B1_9ASTR
MYRDGTLHLNIEDESDIKRVLEMPTVSDLQDFPSNGHRFRRLKLVAVEEDEYLKPLIPSYEVHHSLFSLSYPLKARWRSGSHHKSLRFLALKWDCKVDNDYLVGEALFGGEMEQVSLREEALRGNKGAILPLIESPIERKGQLAIAEESARCNSIAFRAAQSLWQAASRNRSFPLPTLIGLQASSTLSGFQFLHSALLRCELTNSSSYSNITVYPLVLCHVSVEWGSFYDWGFGECMASGSGRRGMGGRRQESLRGEEMVVVLGRGAGAGHVDSGNKLSVWDM